MPRYGYTQNEEEKYIVQSLESVQNGRFLDIGAHDGITFSSTRKLSENGWTGVYVEPSPDVLPLLYKNANPNCTVLPVAIGKSSGSMDFYSSGQDMVGTLSTSHVKLWEKDVQFTKTIVDVITVKDLEEKVGNQFQFINIDVEGINLDVFNQFDWSKWNATCVCVEYEGYKEYMTNVMRKSGYNLIYTSSENLVFSK